MGDFDHLKTDTYTCTACGEAVKKDAQGEHLDTRHPESGTPATIVLHTDTQAAVVSRVKGKSLWVRTVELDESTREATFPIVKVLGDVTRPKGEEERYTLRKSGRYVKVGEADERFSVYLTLGRSVHRVNYAH